MMKLACAATLALGALSTALLGTAEGQFWGAPYGGWGAPFGTNRPATRGYFYEDGRLDDDWYYDYYDAEPYTNYRNLLTRRFDYRTGRGIYDRRLFRGPNRFGYRAYGVPY